MTIITSDILRTVVLEATKQPHANGGNPLQVDYLFREVAEIAKRRGLKFSEQHDAWRDNRHNPVSIYPNLKGPIVDVVWDLIVEGVLRPGQGSNGESNFPYVHLTEHGKKVVDGDVTPYDPEGYLRRLKEAAPNADPVIIRYAAESAATLRQHCLLSSTVMLGVASEQAFLLLKEAYGEALNPADQTAYNTKMEKLRSVKHQHQEFMDWWEKKLRNQVKPHRDSDWLTGVESSLNFVFGYFRDNRNKAGHPSDMAYPRDVCYAHLVMFPTYLRSMYELMDWLNSHKSL